MTTMPAVCCQIETPPPDLWNLPGLALIQIVMTVVVITFLVPFLWMVSSSLKASTEIFTPKMVWIPSESPLGKLRPGLRGDAL